MSDAVLTAVVSGLVTILLAIIAGVVAIIRGNQDAAKERVTATVERGEMGRDIKEIHKQTNSAYEAVTVKADERERLNNERNDKRFAALEELFRSTMEGKTPAPAPVSVNPVTGDPSTPVHVTNVPEDPLHVVDAAEKGKK